MQPAPLNFNMAELESFRYRVEDTARSVTNAAGESLNHPVFTLINIFSHSESSIYMIILVDLLC